MDAGGRELDPTACGDPRSRVAELFVCGVTVADGGSGTVHASAANSAAGSLRTSLQPTALLTSSREPQRASGEAGQPGKPGLAAGSASNAIFAEPGQTF